MRFAVVGGMGRTLEVITFVPSFYRVWEPTWGSVPFSLHVWYIFFEGSWDIQ